MLVPQLPRGAAKISSESFTSQWHSKTLIPPRGGAPSPHDGMVDDIYRMWPQAAPVGILTLPLVSSFPGTSDCCDPHGSLEL